jgi:hypothetical protein
VSESVRDKEWRHGIECSGSFCKTSATLGFVDYVSIVSHCHQLIVITRLPLDTYTQTTHTSIHT